MKVLFVVSAGEDSGIFTSAKTLAGKLREKGVSVEIDALWGNNFDLVHLHTPLPTAFFASKARFRNTPMICTTNMTENELDGLIPNQFVRLSSKYLKIYYSKCDRILCSSSEIKRSLDSAGFSGKTVFFSAFG